MATKYGVIWYPGINIGDDIQTLAAIEYLKLKDIHKYVFVNREKLKSYDGESIKVLMNGWYLYDESEFPPSDKIIPIFISFHCAFPNIIKNNVAYFKKYEPIGCRDTDTVKLFEVNNIKAYYTGCLTTIFPRSNLPRTLITKTGDIFIPDNKYTIDKNLNHIIFNKHPDKFNVEARLKKANEYLDLYKQSKLVITSRLHCAIPCIALGTPILFFHKKYETDPRFSGNKDLLNGTCTLSDAKIENCEEALLKRITFFKSFTI